MKDKKGFILYQIILINILFFLIKSSEFPSSRRLDFYNDSMKICSRSSEELIKYFETGDTQYVKLYEYTDENEPPDYILSFIDYISDEGDSETNFNAYMSHHLPIIFFFIVAIAAIPGWFVCIGCACYKCCYYCCCKNPKCRLPFFIIVTILNILIIITCLLGIIKTNDIFIGLTNTECSLLRFINEILEGESKTVLPKWAGVSGIINIFDNTVLQIDEMTKDNTKSDTEAKMNRYKNAKITFKNNLITICNGIKDEPNYIYNNYILDIAKKFGKYENNNFTEDSYASKWIEQCEFTDNVEKTYNVLGELLISNIGKGMEKAKSIIEDIKDGIEEIKDMIGETFLNYSEKVDEIGRLIFLLIFGVLLAFSILIEALLIFLYIFSSRKCIGNFCCLNFLVKILIHILWNCFALIMIVIFLFGTFLSLIGSIGDDLLLTFSFLISNKNLNSDSPKILGDGGPILNVCINGNGIITDELGIESDLGKIDILKELSYNIDEIFLKIITNEAKTDYDPVYDSLISEIENKNINNDFDFVEKDSANTETKINFKESISSLNQKLETCSINDRWSFSCNTEFSDLTIGTSCSDTNKCINPLICINNELNNRYSTSCSNANSFGNIVDKTITSINFLNNINENNSIRKQAQIIKNNYRAFLSDAKEALDKYTNKITILTAIYDNFVGNGSILGVLNCAFLGKNIKVLLNYLDDSIGKQFKQLGFTLLATGFEMALSISFTILMIVIFNATVDIRENLKITPNIYTGEHIYQSKQKISTNKENENLQNNNLENNNV